MKKILVSVIGLLVMAVVFANIPFIGLPAIPEVIPTFGEIQQQTSNNPIIVFQFVSKALLWSMWVVLFGYSLSQFIDRLSRNLEEARIENQMVAGTTKKQKRAKHVVDPQRSITITVQPRREREDATV